MLGLAAIWVMLGALAGADERIAVEASEDGCPSPAQAVAALEARLPGITRAGEEPARRLRLQRAPGEIALAVRLTDAEGAVVLERSLTVEEPTVRATTPTERCEALAEAVALVVARYLREIGYHAPSGPLPARRPQVIDVQVPPPVPSPMPPPSRTHPIGLVGVGGGERLGVGGGNSWPRGELVLALAAQGRWWAGALAAGATSETLVPVPDSGGGVLALRAFPIRVELGVPFAAGRGTLLPAVGVNVDVLSFRARGLLDAQSGLRTEPALGLSLSYLIPGQRLFARVRAAGALSLAPRDFDARRPAPVFRTPDAYLRLELELGIVLRKNSGGDHL